MGGWSMLRLYIDPGTGSMLFTILIGILGAAIYGIRTLFMKIRFYASSGRQEKNDNSRIPLAIFSDSKRYWNVFEPICDELNKRGQKTVYYTASPDDPALSKSYEHVTCEFIGEGNKAFAKLNMLRADLLLSSTPGLDVFQWKRSRDVKWYVHIPHAANDIVLYRMFGLDYYNAVLLSGDYQVRQIRQLEKLRNLPEKELQIVGITYMDAMKKRKEMTPKLPEHPVTVLLAPSWGESAIFSRYGGKIIEALLKTGYHVIVRPHPQSFTSEKELIDGIMKQYPQSEQLEWNSDNDNFEVLCRSDILISDFSGVIFDFALVYDKPVIYADTTMDTAPYDACWLNEELWTYSILPQIGQHLDSNNLDRIKEVIDACLNDPRYEEGREIARSETWANIGHAADSVADYLISKLQQLQNEGAKVKKQ